MIHLILIVAFIVLLVAKLAGVALSWWLVFAPLIAIAGFWSIVFSFGAWLIKKLDKKYKLRPNKTKAPF